MMKLKYLRHLIMLIMGIMLTTNIYADYSSQRPNRRARARKQYTSPEIIKAEQDMQAL
jgi:hypothetical protein